MKDLCNLLYLMVLRIVFAGGSCNFERILNYHSLLEINSHCVRSHAITYTGTKAWSKLRQKKKMKNAALFLPVRPTVHTSPLRIRDCSKSLSKPGEFENLGSVVQCGPKPCQEGTFRKRSHHDNQMFPCPEFSSNTNTN